MVVKVINCPRIVLRRGQKVEVIFAGSDSSHQTKAVLKVSKLGGALIEVSGGVNVDHECRTGCTGYCGNCNAR